MDKQCQLFFNIYEGDSDYVDDSTAKRNFVGNQCKCALDGKTNDGDCAGFKNKEDCPVSGQVNATLEDPQVSRAPSRGYCSSIMGHELAKNAYQAYAIMREGSNCHTRDRFNMRAQKDEACGIGTSKD